MNGLRFTAWATIIICHYMNGHETCTDSISHTRAIIFFPFVMINATIGSIVASTKTQSNDAWPVRRKCLESARRGECRVMAGQSLIGRA